MGASRSIRCRVVDWRCTVADICCILASVGICCDGSATRIALRQCNGLKIWTTSCCRYALQVLLDIRQAVTDAVDFLLADSIDQHLVLMYSVKPAYYSFEMITRERCSLVWSLVVRHTASRQKVPDCHIFASRLVLLPLLLQCAHGAPLSHLTFRARQLSHWKHVSLDRLIYQRSDSSIRFSLAP